MHDDGFLVHKEISNPDDLDILRAHDVKFGPPNEKHRKRKRKKPASTARWMMVITFNVDVEHITKMQGLEIWYLNQLLWSLGWG